MDVIIPTVDQAAIDEEIIRYRRVFGQEVPVTGGAVEVHDRVGVSPVSYTHLTLPTSDLV